MAVKLFHGFDFSVGDGHDSFGTSMSSTFNVSQVWNTGIYYFTPNYLFHNAGVATLNVSTAPTNSPSGALSCFLNRTTDGLSYGAGGGNATAHGAYTGASTVTRATWATAQGHQLAVVRSRVLPSALSADEYWFSFDIIFNNLGTSSLGSTYLPSASWGAIFKWGDVEVKVKETTYISGSTHDIVFSVRNNGSEVATVTCPGIVAGSTWSSNSLVPVLIHVKLHATLGEIEVAINGVTQSVAYENQNTVATTLEDDAVYFYFGPPVLDNGTNAYVGQVDNFLIDDAAWPSGRPRVRLLQLASDNTLTDAEAAGTSPTTVVAALASGSDATQLRLNSGTAKALLNTTAPSTTGFSSNLIGFYGIAARCANRYPGGTRKLQVGVELSGTESPGANYIAQHTLPFSSISPPPETGGKTDYFEVFEKPSAGGVYTTTDLASIDIYAKTV